MQENQEGAKVYLPGETPQVEEAPQPQEGVQQELFEQEETVEAPVEEQPQDVGEVVQENVESPIEDTPEPVEVTDEPLVIEEIQEAGVVENNEVVAPVAAETPTTEYEWINELVKFAQETGGDLNDYITATKSYDDVADDDVLAAFYKATQPSLTNDEINLLLEDKFDVSDYDEDDREYKLKIIQKKQEISKAKAYLKEQQDKYLVDIKSSQSPGQYQEAVDFYEGHKKQMESNQAIRQNFLDANEKYFSEDSFQGFKFTNGEKNFLFKVSDVQGTKNVQSDINTLLGSFYDDSGNVTDIEGYHKAVYAARNADRIFKHAYELGKAEAIKERAQSSKNIDMNPSTTPKAGANATKPTSRVVFDPLAR